MAKEGVGGLVLGLPGPDLLPLRPMPSVRQTPVAPLERKPRWLKVPLGRSRPQRKQLAAWAAVRKPAGCGVWRACS